MAQAAGQPARGEGQPVRGLADAVVELVSVNCRPRRLGDIADRTDFQPTFDHPPANMLVAALVRRVVEQWSVDEGWHQIANLDPIAEPFAIERFGDRANPELGRRIDRSARRAIYARRAGGVEQA